MGCRHISGNSVATHSRTKHDLPRGSYPPANSTTRVVNYRLSLRFVVCWAVHVPNVTGLGLIKLRKPIACLIEPKDLHLPFYRTNIYADEDNLAPVTRSPC